VKNLKEEEAAEEEEAEVAEAVVFFNKSLTNTKKLKIEEKVEMKEDVVVDVEMEEIE